MKERFTQLLADTQSKMNEERAIVRKENDVIVKELTTKVRQEDPVARANHVS